MGKKLIDRLFPAKQRDIWHKQRTILGIRFVYKTDVPFNKNIEYFNSLDIDNNTIFFFTDSGAYTCNPKYIAQEIIRRNLPYKLYWYVNKNVLKYIKDFPEQINLVMAGTRDEAMILGSCKMLVCNERRSRFLNRGYNKKLGQKIVQTWHGSLGIKCTSGERKDLHRFNVKKMAIDNREIDYLISNGDWDTNFFKRIFDNNGEILEVGHPRNDIFFKDNTELKEKVFEQLNIAKNKKIILYAPTFREDYNMDCYTLDYELLLETVQRKFGGEWVILNRLHPRMINYQSLHEGNDSIINATDYSDMQELLAISDICITDYSSCIYDFILQYKPGFLYAVDAELYDNGRGLQYPLSETPFSVATNNEEMVKNIENFNLEKYQEKVKLFLENKGCIEDGHATEKVVDLIEKIMAE